MADSPAQAIICWSKCEACQFSYHYEEPTEHTWMGDEDLEHARATGQPIPDPLPRCGCWCTGFWPGNDKPLTTDDFARMAADAKAWLAEIEGCAP